MLVRLSVFIQIFQIGLCQINLGSFSLQPSNGGGFNMGIGQGGSIFGFGGDRGFQMGAGPQGFNLQGTQGAVVGGERVGVDSGLAVQPQGGIDVGSQMNFGNNPTPFHPQGQFGGFIDNIKNFFARLVPFPGMLSPEPTTITPPPHPTLRPHVGSEGQLFGERETFSRPEPTFEESKDEESLLPMDGNAGRNDRKSEEKLDLKENEDLDKQTADIFSIATDRPRQLPGLVEFV